jgi:hypothetical protein
LQSLGGLGSPSALDAAPLGSAFDEFAPGFGDGGAGLGAAVAAAVFFVGDVAALGFGRSLWMTSVFAHWGRLCHRWLAWTSVRDVPACVSIGQYQMRFKNTFAPASNLHTASGSFCHAHFDPDRPVLTDRGHFFFHPHLILPFDTGLIFWGIFWLKRAKAKVRKSL